LAQRVGEVVPLHRYGLTHDLVGPAGVVLEALGGRRDLDLPRLEDRLAVVPRLERRELVGPLHHAVGELAEEPPALAGGHLAPRPSERRARRGARRDDVLLARRADRRDGLLRRGADHAHGPAAAAAPPPWSAQPARASKRPADPARR